MNFLRGALYALCMALAVPLTAGLVLSAAVSPAQAAVVSSISVQGNQRVDDATVKAYMTIQPGVQFGEADIDESVKALYRTGLFSDVSIVRSGGTLVVNVAENPIINSVVFEGNDKVKSEILIQLVDSETRGVLTEAMLQSDVERIRAHYARNGRADVVIEPRVNQIGNNRVDVVFYINEGDRTGVDSITFVGNEAFSSSRLRGVINTQKTNWLSWLNRGDVFSEDKFAADQEALRRHYMRYGYADFQILSADAVFDPEEGAYHLTFVLEEGPRYRFGTINIDSSIPGVDTVALEDVVLTRSGKVFDSTKVERTVEDLTIELARMGFVFSQVRPRGDRNYVDNIIDLTYVIDEGPRVYIERIEIRGNTKTRDFVIRREFPISEGDPYNRVLIDKAERNLIAMDFFSVVNISTAPGSAPDKVIVQVYVQDKSTGSLSFAAGMSTSDGIIGEVTLEERNLLGRGQQLRITLSGAITEDTTFNLAFTDPYFLGNDMSAGFDFYRNNNGRSDFKPYETITTGGGLRLGLPLTDESNLTLNYRLINQEIRNSSATDLFPVGDTWTSSVGYRYTFSTIDNRADPRDGVFFRLSQDFAGLGGDTAYVRTEATASYYRPVIYDSDIIGLVKVSGGNITGLGKAVAASDNFFKGGETVRGFKSLGYGPRKDDSFQTAAGGRNYLAGTAEVQFPIPFIPPDFGLRAAAFADAGMLWDVDNAPATDFFSDNSVRSSVGASLLWASPFGLLRADVAHVLTKKSYDKTQVFRVGIGNAF